MQAVNEPGRATPLSATETRPDRATHDHPPSPEVRCYHTPELASNAITLACAGQVAARDLAKPAATQMTLDPVAVGTHLADRGVLDLATRKGPDPPPGLRAPAWDDQLIVAFQRCRDDAIPCSALADGGAVVDDDEVTPSRR